MDGIPGTDDTLGTLVTRPGCPCAFLSDDQVTTELKGIFAEFNLTDVIADITSSTPTDIVSVPDVPGHGVT